MTLTRELFTLGYESGASLEAPVCPVRFVHITLVSLMTSGFSS